MRHPTFQDPYLTSNLTVTTAQFVVYLWSISSSLQLLVLIILSSAVFIFLRGVGWVFCRKELPVSLCCHNWKAFSFFFNPLLKNIKKKKKLHFSFNV